MAILSRALFIGLILSSIQSWALCIQNFNAYGPIYASKVTKRTLLTTQELLRNPCEVVHLQEVWNESQINLFAKGLGQAYQVSAPNREMRIGLMSFVQSPILKTETYSFRLNSDSGVLDTIRSIANVRKAFHVVTIKDQGRELKLVNTHLHPSSSAVRLTQLMDILFWRLNNMESDWVVSGDINAGIDSLELQFLQDVLQVKDAGKTYFGGSYPADFCTYCQRNPLGWLTEDRTFDYVFLGLGVYSPLRWNVFDFRVNLEMVGDTYLSDHFGVRVVADRRDQIYRKIRVDFDSGRVLRTLVDAEQLLLREKKPEYQMFIEHLRELQKQILKKRGLYYNYWLSLSKKQG